MNTKKQTEKSFNEKWHKNRQLAFDETLREDSDIFNWILNRNGFDTVNKFSNWLSGRKRILDAGCGNGRVTALLRKYAQDSSHIVGIDLTAADVAAVGAVYTAELLQAAFARMKARTQSHQH